MLNQVRLDYPNMYSGARPRNQMVQRLHNLDVLLLYRPPTLNLKQRAKVGKIDEKLRVLKLVTFGIRIKTANLPMCPHQVLIDKVFAKKHFVSTPESLRTSGKSISGKRRAI